MDRSIDSSSEQVKKQNSKLTQVVQNFFIKVSQIIIQARTAETKSQEASHVKINKWFNLHMPSLEGDIVRSEVRPWKTQSDLSRLPPMIIETYLDLRQLSPCQMVLLEDDIGNMWPVFESRSTKREVVLERWLIEFDSTLISSASLEELPLVYKHAIILIRSIYGIVRLLPSYKAKKLLAKSSNKNLFLNNKIFDGNNPISSKGRVGLSKPIIPHQMLLTDSHMTQRDFLPIQTALGTIKVSVAYRNHYKFKAQDQEERLSNHFLSSDKEKADQEVKALEVKAHELDLKAQALGQRPTDDSKLKAPPTEQKPRSSFDGFQEKYSVSPCTSELHEKELSPTKQTVRAKNSPAPSSNIPSSNSPVPNIVRPSIQPFRVGSIGSSSPPPTSIPSSSMERRISITSNRSGSNASLIALLRHPRGSTSSSNNTSNYAIPTQTNVNQASLPRSISSSHGSHLHDEMEGEHTPNTPKFSSSFGSRQSRRFSSTSSKFAPGSNTENAASFLSTSIGSCSSDAPFSGLYADDDISSFVQMIDGKSDLRLNQSNQGSKLATPNNEGSSHVEALNKYQLLKSQYQQLGDSVHASLSLYQTSSRSGNDLRHSSKSPNSTHSQATHSPSPSVPLGTQDHAHLPSISSRLSQDDQQNEPQSGSYKSNYNSNFVNPKHLVASPQTSTSMVHAQTKPHNVVSGLATSPSVYETAKRPIKYENVFDDDDDDADFYHLDRHRAQLPRQTEESSYDHDDLLFEMTDTK